MAKKPLGLDKMGIQKTMRIGDYLGDCGGQFALNAINGLIGAILYFYTDKIGVSAAVAANVLLAAKVVDAFTDLIMGKIMDSCNSPKGKCRPWFLRMAIPCFAVTVALFTVPSQITGFAQVAYLFLTNVLATGVVSTAIVIPYSAIMVMRTKSLEERSTMGIFRAAAGYIIAIVGPMTKKFGVVRTLQIAFGLGIIANVVRVFFPNSLTVLLTIGMLCTFSTIPMMCLGGTMNTMTMDYNDYLYHNKIVGMSASATSFGSKVANGLGASLIGWILAVAGYDHMGETLTASVRYGIYAFSIYLPLLAMIGLFLMASAFDLEKKYPQIIAAIKARNTAE